MKTVRCAIYTRKSSDEGLDQAFNSLDAQRESCAAYILSQASEGWTALPDIYDDGGLSGGTLERPALQRLLAEVQSGKVDIIVVYKVDRLTRSLFDFAKLVETFDKAGTSFVSVTQSFNTTTSMGRLTLNMLLSFAQFEREVTAERIRDKIAASKAKGMWMGGTPPLGYAPDGRSLKIVEDHAALVRMLYERCLEAGNVPRLLEQLDREKICIPVRTLLTGKAIGGGKFIRGPLYHLLRNPIYVGDIAHRDRIYPGSHPPIIDRGLWDQVQRLLDDNRQGTRTKSRASSPSLLAGRIVDADGEPLIATHACKPVVTSLEGGKVRYRYYISRALQLGERTTGIRVPAREIEGAVVERIAQAFDDPLSLIEDCEIAIGDVELFELDARTGLIAVRLRARERDLVQQLVTQVRILTSGLEIDCNVAGIADAIGASPVAGAPPLTLIAAVRLTRSGRAMRLIDVRGAPASHDANRSLARLVAQGHQYWRTLRTEPIDITRLAEREEVSASWVARLVRLAFLSPTVTEAILAGKQPVRLDGRTLIATDGIPPTWSAQREKLLGHV